ncbi:hypothetical protein OG689_44280 [Kitasatospora sp. NBC_00240]|uniref:hypothetical protein n=1 Tax=Kitasatospora sp. NBC_00240 TaxID=2903567 RepID=UPI00224EA2BE|nr:hypothetical protein [Kitasatospora sp. NBC_00240]MCX5216156.1 hypothetical protein [Kitasatospora sp. NBC_00240]
MTTRTAIPTAQPRKRQTCTKNISCRPALLLSELPPTLVELTPRAEHLACPDCNTWCPLTTDKTTKQWKLVPHHILPAGTPGARRCINSNRLFEIDMPITVWQQRRAEAVAEVASRRPTTVLKKVKAPQPPAVLHIAQRRSDDPVGSDKQRAKRRTREWDAARVDVLVTDALRQHPLYGAKGPIFSLPLPDGVPTEPPRKQRKQRKGRLAA